MKKSIFLASALTLAVALPVVFHSSKALSAVPVQANPNLPNTTEFDSEKYYRFTSLFLGKGKSLNVSNGIEDRPVHLANSEANLKGTMGQYWKIEKLGGGYYRIKPLLREFKEEGLDMSLDIVPDNLAEDSIGLSRTDNVTGQAWKIEKNSDGYYRLTNKFFGAGKSLDVVNDGKKKNVQLAPTGEFTGQAWIITEIPTLAEPTTPKPTAPTPSTGAALTAEQLPPPPPGGLTVQNFRSYAAFNQPIDAKKPDDAHALLSVVLYLVTNEARVKQGKSVIPHHPLLTQAAINYAEEMVTKDFFDHDHPSDPAQRTPTDRGKLAGIKNAQIAENIYGGIGIHVHTYLSLAQSMVDGWMSSPGHRANILSDDSRGLGCGMWLYHDRNNAFSVRAVQKFQLFKDVEVEPLNPNLPKPTAPKPNLPTPLTPPTPSTGAALTAEQQLLVKEATRLPLTTGFVLKKGMKYPSPSGNFNLLLGNDSNLMVTDKNGGYLWGTDQVIPNFGQAGVDRVELRADGSLGSYNAQGAAVWTAPITRRDPAAKLNLTDDGDLQLVAGNGDILWAHNGILLPRIKVFTRPVALTPCSETGWDRCVELADPKIKIISTNGVSASVVNAVANIYTEMMNRLKPTPTVPDPKRKFDGFKVYITNNESWDVQSKLPVVGTMWKDQTGPMSGRFLQGGASNNFLWISEQMIAKKGVKIRNDDGTPDNYYRTFDQVVHEMAHSIDFQLVDDNVVNQFDGNVTPVESFAYRVQQWFGVPAGPIPQGQETLLSAIFSSRAVFSIEGYRP